MKKLNEMMHGLLRKMRTYILLWAMFVASVALTWRCNPELWPDMIQGMTWLWGMLLGWWIGGKGWASYVATRKPPE